MSLLLKDCNIIDATTPEVRGSSYVLVEGEEILEVGMGQPPSADQAIELGGAYLLPGLWDVHTHLRKGTWGPEFVEEEARGTVPKILGHARHAMDALASGVTSLRVVGIKNWTDVALREAFASGQFMGPRLFCCGNGLNPTAGHMADTEAVALDGPVAFIRAVRDQIMHGVDQIKLVTTGGIMGSGHDVMTNIMFLKEELEAALRIANQRGVPTAVHATVAEAVKWAVEAGAHSIEHGYVLDEEAANMIAQRGVYYVPTLALSHLTPEQAATDAEASYCEAHQLPDIFRDRANHFAPTHEESFKMALEAGVKIASGSDQGPPGEATLLEIEFLSKCGLGPYGAIVAATRTSAEVCKAESRLGTVEPGKLADFIVVDTNPLENIQNLRRQKLVIKGGEVVIDKRDD